MDDLKAVAASTSIPISTGEHFETIEQAASAVASGVLSFIQPEVAWNCGILETIKMTSLAEGMGIRIATHVHLASKTDPEANQIFIVNEKPFTKISTQTTAGSHWGQNQWHRVRVQRIGSKISVWFDDMTTPAMLAEDASFGAVYCREL